MLQSSLAIGVAAALAAGLLWGLVFVAPLLLSDYPATLLSFGRYFAFGLVTLPIAWWQRAALRRLTRADWWLATKLSIVMLAIYLGFILLVAFAPHLLAVPLAPGLAMTWGIPVGVLVILSAFILTGVYVRRANGEFDQLTREILEEVK